jgi:hypothetical protein
VRGTVINLDVEDSLGICRAMPVASLKHRTRILKMQLEEFEEFTLNLTSPAVFVNTYRQTDSFACYFTYTTRNVSI